MRALLVVLAFAPSAAFACAMPPSMAHLEEAMAAVDANLAPADPNDANRAQAAAAQPAAPAAQVAPAAEVAPVPAAIPEVQAPAPAKVVEPRS